MFSSLNHINHYTLPAFVLRIAVVGKALRSVMRVGSGWPTRRVGRGATCAVVMEGFAIGGQIVR